MKRELLRIQNLNKSHDSLQIFKEFSFNVYEGENLGILMPHQSGKTTLARILMGEEDISAMAYFDETPVGASFKKLYGSGQIVCLRSDSRLFEDLTLAENMLLCTPGQRLLSPINHARLNSEAQKYIDELSLPVVAGSKPNMLSVFHQHMILLAGALCRGVKLVVFDDAFGRYGLEKMPELRRILDILNAQGVSTIWLFSGHSPLFEILDRVIVVSSSKKIRTIYEPAATTEAQIAAMLSPPAVLGASPGGAYKSAPPPVYAGAELLTMKNVSSGILSQVDLSLHEGEAVGVCSANSAELKALRNIFDSDAHISGIVDILGKNALSRSGGLSEKNRSYYVITPSMGTDTILRGFSLLDNILLPLCACQRSMSLIGQLGTRKSLVQEIEASLGLTEAQQQRPIESFDFATRLNVVLLSLLLRRPNFVVFSSMYCNIDSDTREIFIKYFKQFLSSGTGLLLLLSELSSYEELLSRAYEMKPLADGSGITLAPACLSSTEPSL